MRKADALLLVGAIMCALFSSCTASHFPQGWVRNGVFVVVGANGGTGRQLVHRLAECPPSEVKEIRALVRKPSDVQSGALPDDARVKVVKADAGDPSSLQEPLRGARAVFFAAQGRSYQDCVNCDELGVKHVAEISKAHGVNRVVLISSQSVHPCNRWYPVRIILNTMFTPFSKRGIMDMKWSGECHLRESGQSYTVIRPGRLVDGPLGAGLPQLAQVNGPFKAAWKTTRADLSLVCLAAAASPGARDCTFALNFSPLPKGADSPPADSEAFVNLFRDLQPGWPLPGQEP